jgi:hypothetical protein
MIDDKLGFVLKEAVVTQLKFCLGVSLEELGKTKKSLG